MASPTKPKTSADLVAQGLWSRVEGKWCVLKMRGHRSTPEPRPDLEKLSRTFSKNSTPLSVKLNLHRYRLHWNSRRGPKLSLVCGICGDSRWSCELWVRHF